MTKLRMGIRSLRYILSGNVEYKQWQRSFFQIPKTMAMYAQGIHNTGSLDPQPRKKVKEVKSNRNRKKQPILVDNETQLRDIIDICGLTTPIIRRTLQNLNWDIDPYKPVIYKDKRKICQFLKQLDIPFTMVGTKKIKPIKEVKYVRPPPDESVLVRRPPIITVMGHVDHGKTTLLDTLRKTAVAKSEEGGITQRIGVFNVKLGDKMFATVLDTPGHVAFNSMRERGAIITDIIVMVVAADDGVMEQTEDTIRLATETNTPIIVALNKIDKPNADISLTQQMLAEHGVQVEQLDGDVQCVPISALKGTNLDKLIEAIELQANILEPKGDPTGLIEGYIIETSVDPKLGKMATILIQRGTLKNGAILKSGEAITKVRFMLNYLGETVPQAGLAEAVQVSGWKELPRAGDTVLEIENMKKAKEILKLEKRQQEALASTSPQISSDEPQGEESQAIQENTNAYNIVLKTDSVGSMEAVQQLLDTYDEHDKCKLSIVHSDVGNVTPNDISLAKTFNATIYCFNTKVPDNLKEEIEEDNVPVYNSNVIYTLIGNIKNELVKKFPFIDTEEVIGQADVLRLFTFHEKKVEVVIAGCICVKGMICKNGLYHIKRNGEIIDTGEIESLKYLKNDVSEVKKGSECGIRLSNKDLTLEIGDTVIVFKKVPKKAECLWNPGQPAN